MFKWLHTPTAGRLSRLAVVVAAIAMFLAGAASSGLTTPSASLVSSRPSEASKTCPPGYVDATLSWGEKCLHAGQFCKVGNLEYHAYGFDCPADGHLVDYRSATPTTTTATTTTTANTLPVAIGHTVFLVPARTQTHSCTRGALPDRQCSPGAYYSGLTRSVICSESFRTSTVRNVPQSQKYAVETEYGMVAKSYGRTMEIDHIVSLELGGSNDIANLFPEAGSGIANYHAKDKLENKLHALVCTGTMTLTAARTGIAKNWKTLYKHVYGVTP
jgi:hypothetical protein